jgi:hypothetical protein
MAPAQGRRGVSGTDERLAALAALFDPARGPDALARLAEPGSSDAAARARHLASLSRRERLAALADALSRPRRDENTLSRASEGERAAAAAAIRRPGAAPALRRAVRERLDGAAPSAGASAVRAADPGLLPPR